MRLAPASTLHRDPTIKTSSPITSMQPLTNKQICAKIHTEKNENLLYTLQQPRREEDITFKIIHIIESTRNVRAFLDYVYMITHKQINDKYPHVPIIHFNILVRFNIQRNFRASLSVRASNSGQPVNCARKYYTKKTVAIYTS